jgi:phosphopantetheinyl transferase
MSRVILYHATLPDRLETADTRALRERIAYARRVTLADRRGDRELTLAGIALALAAARALGGAAPSPESLRFPAGGKPVFAEAGAPVFSIAHSGRTVIAGARAAGAIGVDVEHPAESGLAPESRRRWSAREAAVKALGLGLWAATEVEIGDGTAQLRGTLLRLQMCLLPCGAEVWVATDTDVHAIELVAVDPLVELRRQAA